MNPEFQIPRHSRRNFIRQVAADAAVVGLTGALTPFRALAQAVSPATNTPAPGIETRTWVPVDGPNQPIGTPKGIFPGRVTWMRDPSVARWDGKTGRWWDEDNIDQPGLENLWSKSVRALSGAATDAAAWEQLFLHFNRTHRRGNAGWQKGESIAVKINVNNAYAGYPDQDYDIDASAQSILALLRQLVKAAGVAEPDIVIYDSSPGGKVNRQRAIPDRIYDPCHAAFPQVRWVDCQGLNGRRVRIGSAMPSVSPRPAPSWETIWPAAWWRPPT